LLLVILTGLSSCNMRSTDKEAKSENDTYLTEKKQETMMEYQHRLQIAESEINQIRADAEQMGMEARQAALEKVNALQSHYDSIENAVYELKDSSGDAWDELKEGLEAAFSKIEGSIDDAKEEFETES